MHFVGPRPEVRKYVDMYTAEEQAILNVRPGITDWASIWNSDEGAVLAGSPDPDRAYEELIRPTKLRLQLQYVREQSLRTDLRILVCTALRLLHSTYTPPELASYRPLMPAQESSL
jgi:lipopolysaccharide/colanic/teichoic acid biosynthesis glycosyltransferase